MKKILVYQPCMKKQILIGCGFLLSILGTPIFAGGGYPPITAEMKARNEDFTVSWKDNEQATIYASGIKESNPKSYSNMSGIEISFPWVTNAKSSLEQCYTRELYVKQLSYKDEKGEWIPIEYGQPAVFFHQNYLFYNYSLSSMASNLMLNAFNEYQGKPFHQLITLWPEQTELSKQIIQGRPNYNMKVMLFDVKTSDNSTLFSKAYGRLCRIEMTIRQNNGYSFYSGSIDTDITKEFVMPVLFEEPNKSILFRLEIRKESENYVGYLVSEKPIVPNNVKSSDRYSLVTSTKEGSFINENYFPKITKDIDFDEVLFNGKKVPGSDPVVDSRQISIDRMLRSYLEKNKYNLPSPGNFKTYAHTQKNIQILGVKRFFESNYQFTAEATRYRTIGYDIDKKRTYTKESFPVANFKSDKSVFGKPVAQPYFIRADQSYQDKKIKLSWEAPEIKDGDTEAVFYVLKKSSNSQFAQVATVDYSNVSKTSSGVRYYVWEDSDVELNEEYTYSVRRFPSKQWEVRYQLDSKLYLFEEVTIKPDWDDLLFGVTAERKEDGNKVGFIEVNWILGPSPVVFPNISWKLFMRQTGDKEWNEVPIDPAKLTKTLKAGGCILHTYIDKNIESCRSIEYRVELLYNKINIQKSTPSILTNAAANFFQNVIVSKGLHNDVVEITYTLDKNAPTASVHVERREHNNENGEYQKVGELRQVRPGIKETWVDSNVAPIMYDYRLVSEYTCPSGQTTYVYSMPQIGFINATAKLTGTILFTGGTPVANVAVSAYPISNSLAQGYSLSRRGTLPSGVSITSATSSFYDFSKAFTLQFWVRKMHNPESVGKTVNLNGTLPVAIQSGDSTVSVQWNKETFSHSIASFPRIKGEFYWDHVSISYDGTKTTIYLNGEPIGTTTSTQGYLATSNIELLEGVEDKSGRIDEPLAIDELRVWSTGLDSLGIAQTYNIYLSGTEENLVGYWKFDERMQGEFYDYSVKERTPNQNHCYYKTEASTVTYSTWTPSSEQLSYRGYTDTDGSYTIMGIPYTADGSSYHVVPSMNSHSFEPKKETLFFDKTASVVNNLKFKDISSFRVEGQVFYSNSRFPIKGAMVNVDGQTVMLEGKPVETDEKGRFVVDVPIGNHSISVTKTGQTFENEGRFPVKGTYNFTRDMTIETPFYNTSRSRVLGRIVGGKIEGAKTLGFNLSRNFLGKTSLILKASFKESYQLTSQANKPDTILIQHPYNQNVNGTKTASSSDCCYTRMITRPSLTPGEFEVEIIPDSTTGEFVADLLPEHWVVISALIGKDSSGKNKFYPEFLLPKINLVNKSSNGSYVTLPTKKEQNGVGGATTVTEADTIYYSGEKVELVRINPAMFDVKQLRAPKPGLFGESQIDFFNGQTQKKDSIPLINKQGYVMNNRPVFVEGKDYKMKIRMYEVYGDGETGTPTDTVNVTDGQLRIYNSLSTTPSVTVNVKDELIKDSLILKDYAFVTTEPSLAVLPDKAADNFTKTFYMIYVSQDGSSESKWGNEKEPFAYLLGSQMKGTNFVTTGPKAPTMILRDPPGSNSYATFTERTINSKITLDAYNEEEDFELSADIQFKAETSGGLGIITQIAAVENQAGIKINQSYNHNNSTTTSLVTTLSKDYSTSSEPNFVGADADIIMGNATNIFYGEATSLKIYPVGNYPAGIDASSIIPINDKYVFAKRDAIATGLSLGTSFVYTVKSIESTQIPDLKKIRTSLISPIGTPPSIDKNKPVYISKVAIDDPQYGETGTYTVTPSGATDSVEVYNNEIEGWIEVLRINEEDKVLSFKDDKNKAINRSFSGGTSATYSSEVEAESATVHSTYHKQGALAHAKLDFVVTTVGPRVETYLGGYSEYVHENTNATKKDSIFAYTLADGDASDKLSVNIIKSRGGFSPVFKLMGGQTMYPYEPKVMTKYYEPGMHVLSEGSAQTDKPFISIVPIQNLNVPGNRSAKFEVTIDNQSETKEDMDYVVAVRDGTNPKGAKLSWDGMVLGKIPVILRYGEPQTHVLTLERTNENVDSFDNIVIELRSAYQYFVSNLDDIVSQAVINATFNPSCGPLEWISKTNGTIMNSSQMDTLSTHPQALKGVLPLRIGNYDYSNPRLQQIDLLYKGASETDLQWRTLRRYKKEGKLQEGEELLPKNEIYYNWNMLNLPDRRYEVKAVARSLSTAENAPISETDKATVSLDTQSPKPLGKPQPSDGVLTSSNDISIQFNEVIDKSLIDVDTQQDLTVTGILNNAIANHSVGVLFSDTSYVRIPSVVGISSLTGVTIDCWVSPQINKDRHVLLAHDLEKGGLKVGFLKNNRLFVEINSESMDVPVTFPSDGTLVPIRIVIKDDLLTLYYNNQIVINKRTVGRYVEDASLLIGCDPERKSYYNGRLSDFRIWNRAMVEPEFSDQRLTGNELDLYGYWPMDEGQGDKIHDRARGRHANSYADWFTTVTPYGVKFDGNSHLTIPIESKQAIINEDLTLEFWMRAKKTNEDEIIPLIYHSSKDNNSEYLLMLWDMGRIAFVNNESIITVENTNNLQDNQWHHVALVSTYNRDLKFYVDGVMVFQSTEDSEINIFGGSNLLIGQLPFLSGESYVGGLKGEIDELRLWKRALPESILRERSNIRLKGDETALLLYYPFESTKEQQVVPSLVNQCKGYAHQQGVHTDPANWSGTGMTIKPTEPISNIPFTWTASDDKIVISLTQDEKYQRSLEGVRLSIGVNRVFDLSGNASSPVGWEAIVLRKNLRWTDTEYVKRIEEGKAYSSKIKFYNASNALKHYTVKNLPAWCWVDEPTGVIAPFATKEIELRLPDDLVSDVYEGILDLSDDIYTDHLKVAFTVRSSAPDWKPNKDDAKYTMNIFGNLQIEGIPSIDPEDIVGAFIGNQCCGVGSPTYIPQYDRYNLFLKIYNDSVGSKYPLTFRIWKASEGVIYPGYLFTPKNEKLTSLFFESQKVIGTISAPAIVNTLNEHYQSISVGKGWSWISFNVESDQLKSAESILHLLDNQECDEVKEWVNGTFDRYDSVTKKWEGTLSGKGGFKLGEMYGLRSANGGEILVSGKQPTSVPSINLGSGWNYIGYLPQQSLPINEALSYYNAAEDDLIKTIDRFSIYDRRAGWIGDLTTLHPGQGYMLLRRDSAETTLIYPHTGNKPNMSHTKSVMSSVNYQSNATFVAEVVGISPDPTDKVVLINDHGVQIPASQIATQYGMRYFFTAGSDSLALRNPVFALEREGKIYSYAHTCLSSVRANESNGTLTKPLKLNFGEANRLLVQAFPNPFVDYTNIRVIAPEGVERARVELLDPLGRAIKQWGELTLLQNQTQFTLNLTDISAVRAGGLFFLQVSFDNGQQEIVKLQQKP